MVVVVVFSCFWTLYLVLDGYGIVLKLVPLVAVNLNCEDVIGGIG